MNYDIDVSSSDAVTVPGGELDGQASPEERAELLAAIFHHTNDAIFLVDVERDQIVECNEQATELVGFSRSELLSMSASDLHPHNFDEFQSFADRVLERGSARAEEITCYRADGELVPTEMSATVVEIDGRPHVLNHARGRPEEEHREYYELLTEHSQDILTVLDEDGIVQYQDNAVSEVLGHDSESISGEEFFDWIHRDDRPRVAEALETAARGEEATDERVEYRFATDDGSWVWIESAITYRPQSGVDGFVLNSREITARKENRQQASVLHRVLRHNLRNELTVILGFSEQLTEVDNPEVAAAAERIHERASKLEDVAACARLLSNIFESHHVPQTDHDLSEIVSEVADEITDGYPETTLTVRAPDGLSVEAAPRIEVVVRQLVENAVKHNESDSPRVEVTVRERPTDEERVELIVADDGPGIPEQERATLLEGKEQPLQHGSGLGLWLVNWIVNRSGGRIEFAESTLGGSEVTVMLRAA
ncbi:MAG: PAS domain S-box protein [Halobaculum sp.]